LNARKQIRLDVIFLLNLCVLRIMKMEVISRFESSKTSLIMLVFLFLIYIGTNAII